MKRVSFYWKTFSKSFTENLKRNCFHFFFLIPNCLNWCIFSSYQGLFADQEEKEIHQGKKFAAASKSAEQFGRLLLAKWKNWGGTRGISGVAQNQQMYWKQIERSSGAQKVRKVAARTRNTPLHQAIINNSDIEETLLQAEGDPNSINNEGNTPLHISCQYSCITCLSLLIKYGGNTMLPNRKGFSLLHIAVSTAPWRQGAAAKMAKFLLELWDHNDNCKNFVGETPLSVAKKQDCDRIIQLLKYGADCNADIIKSKVKTVKILFSKSCAN